MQINKQIPVVYYSVLFFTWIWRHLVSRGCDDEVMCVTYDLKNDTLNCINWYGQKIDWLSGKFSMERWEAIKIGSRRFDYDNREGGFGTTITIFDSDDKKGMIASCEPIHDYLEKEPSEEIIDRGNMEFELIDKESEMKKILIRGQGYPTWGKKLYPYPHP